jgi:hypothetical protein
MKTLTPRKQKPLTPKRQKALDELTARVMALHSQVGQALRAVILLAKEAGDLLFKIKKCLRHGEFGEWLDKNFHSSPETARVYMRISQKWYRIESEVEKNPRLSIARATEILRVKKEVPPPPPPPKGQAARDELRETFLILLEKWTDEQLVFLLEETDDFPSRLDECLEVTLSKMEPAP